MYYLSSFLPLPILSPHHNVQTRTPPFSCRVLSLPQCHALLNKTRLALATLMPITPTILPVFPPSAPSTDQANWSLRTTRQWPYSGYHMNRMVGPSLKTQKCFYNFLESLCLEEKHFTNKAISLDLCLRFVCLVLFFGLLRFIIIIIIIITYQCVCVHECRCFWRPEVLDPSGAEVTGRGKGLFGFQVTVHHPGKPSKSSRVRVGVSQRQGLKKRHGRRVLTGLLFLVCSTCIQGHLPRDGSTHSGRGPCTSIIN